METIDNYIKFINSMSRQYKIILLCNVKGLTNTFMDYDCDSLEGDYYTLSEFQEIKDAILDIGFEIISFFNEMEFINYILNNKGDVSHYLVISTAKTGTYLGRKSLIPAFCELNQIRYLGCDPYTISFAKDKFHWHLLLEKCNIQIPVYWIYNYKNGWLANKKPENHLKVISKLNNESCGIGLTNNNILIYNNDSDYYINFLSQKYNQSIIVEEFISGYEIEVPVLILSDAAIAFEPCSITINHSILLKDLILDYETRKNDSYEYTLYSKYDKELSSKLQKKSIEVAKSLNLTGLCRIDYRINERKEYFVTDIATTPFFNKNTSVRIGFEKMGYTYKDFISLLIYSIIDKSFPII